MVADEETKEHLLVFQLGHQVELTLGDGDVESERAVVEFGLDRIEKTHDAHLGLGSARQRVLDDVRVGNRQSLSSVPERVECSGEDERLDALLVQTLRRHGHAEVVEGGERTVFASVSDDLLAHGRTNSLDGAQTEVNGPILGI